MATDGPQHRSVEIAVAVLCLAFGFLIIGGSIKAGIGWGAEGPRSGFFPFYIGVMIVVSSLVNLKQAWSLERGELFANWGQIGQVLAVVVPTTVYVFVMPYTGIYLASFVLITGFMIWIGNYRYVTSLAVGVAIPLIIYFTFEKWFLVPLPKGPIEDWLGL